MQVHYNATTFLVDRAISARIQDLPNDADIVLIPANWQPREHQPDVQGRNVRVLLSDTTPAFCAELRSVLEHYGACAVEIERASA